MIKMPPRNSMADLVAKAASKCLRFACERHFKSVRLGDLTQIISGGTPNTNNSAFWDGDIVWVTPRDLGRPRNIEITDSERRITEIGNRNSSARLLPIGTVLLSSRAPIGHLGISAVPLCTNQGFKNIICSDLLNKLNSSIVSI
jgi:type I restriction enzyme, S subunit